MPGGAELLASVTRVNRFGWAVAVFLGERLAPEFASVRFREPLLCARVKRGDPINNTESNNAAQVNFSMKR